MAAGYSTREVARMLKIPEQRLREFVRAGILGPHHTEQTAGQCFDFRDMLVLRMAMRLVSNGLPARRVKKALVLLQNQIRAGQPLSGVQLFAEGGKVLASDGHALWEPESGQQRLRFDAPAAIAEGAQATTIVSAGAAASTSNGKDAAGRALNAGASANAGPGSTNPSAATDASGLPASADGWFDVAMQLEDCEPHRAYEVIGRAHV